MSIRSIKAAALAGVMALTMTPLVAPFAHAEETLAAPPTGAPTTQTPAPESTPSEEPTFSTQAPSAEPVAVARPSATSVGAKVVGLKTNTWGTAQDAPHAEAWTEVKTPSGWSRSQTRTTNANGRFAIPLTYGANTPGKYVYRVAIAHPSGKVTRSTVFTLERLAKPTAHTAGKKEVGQLTNAWGTFDGGADIEVWTQVKVNGNWSTSQKGRTKNNGSYVLPLTYGANTPGTYVYRVGGRYPDGSVVYSKSVKLVRTEKPGPTGTKYDWMRAAGIPESDWEYVDYIVKRESGWNPKARNRSSGACGLPQALPCSKLGPNWDDPVHALKWQHQYVKNRYGGYKGAYDHSRSRGWY